MFGSMPSTPNVSDPPDLPPSLAEGESDDVFDWVMSRFEKIGYDPLRALELAVGRVDHHAAQSLVALMGKAGYDEQTAREMAAEILL